MRASKNFNLFLMDGEVTGRIKCTLSNWTGLAYKVPRTYLDRCKNRADLKRSGVYFLFGKNVDGQAEVYIGQAGTRKNGEGVLYRVLEHMKDATYFSEVVMLTTQNNSFGPTEISYLENKFTKMAADVGRFELRNGNDPNPGNVTEEKESELLDFIEYSKMVLGVLGYKVFVPLVEDPPKAREFEEDIGTRFYMSRFKKATGRLIEAECIHTAEGFVVLAGSSFDLLNSKGLMPSLGKLRNECIKRGEVVDGILMKDYWFTSPSTAASFVLGASCNGRTQWRTKEGIRFCDLDEGFN